MSTGPAPQPGPVGHPRLKSGTSPALKTLETLLLAILAALLTKLHRNGILFPGLPAWQFIAVLLGVLLALAGIIHLIRRISAARGER
jgi:hypothetical protein